MATGSRPTPQTIALQVGSELRITATGEYTLSNPTVEVENAAADAVISLAYDPATKEHVIRLIDPLVEHGDRPNAGKGGRARS
jgi:hypothetical protein